MSLNVFAWAVEKQVGSPKRKLLLLAMADGADMDGWIDAPSDYLLKICEFKSLGSINSSLEKLKRDYLITWNGTRARLLCPAFPGAVPTPDAKRKRIYARDGGRCVYCGSTDRLTLDHVIPRSRGGSNKAENLVTACGSCNSRKGARTPEEWRGT